jgi:serine/threonine protein kinase/ActR/RegA family two-component response regulator
MEPSEHTLLVVDDEEMNRDVLSRRLERKGYQVVVAAGGREAIDAVAARPIDLVLLDVMMPGVDGLQVLQTLRRHHSQTELPIIMATAKGESEDVVRALELGANDYVVKPLDFPVVLARVESQLRSRAAAPKAPVEPGEREPSPSEVGPGVTLAGKYRLDALLGSGTFGAVYRARHLELDHDVAVKVLRSTMSSDPEALSRFRSEGAAACRLNHPNAVAVHDSGVTGGDVAYLVMELLDGVSLDRELSECGTLTPRRSAEILLPVLDVLAEAHDAGLIHRDVKPGNVFLHQSRGREVVKVLDFGIAKLMGETATSQQLTRDGLLIGTPTYMAPERLNDQDYDGRSDVYSVGVMLYLMLTGRLPYAAERGDLIALVVQHMKQPVPSVREHAPGVPAEVEAVVTRALAKSPEERPEARELARHLSAAVGLPAGEETTAAVSAPSAPSAPSAAADPSGTSAPAAPDSRPVEIDATVSVGAVKSAEAGSGRAGGGGGLGGLLRRLRGRRTDR